MQSFVGYLGKAAINSTKSMQGTFSLSFQIIWRIFDKYTYSGPPFNVLINQIYFTAVQILPLFLTVSVVIGSLLVSMILNILKEFGLSDYLGHIIMGFVVTELSPFLTVLLIALRSSAAMNTEIATMKLNKELHALEAFHIDVISYLFLPRVLSGVISVVLLSGIFSIIVLASGFVSSKIIFGMSLEAYANLLLKSAAISDMIILLIKCSTFGFFITIIPIRSGLNVSEELTSIPVAVLNGMVKVFNAIVIIEVLTLIARSF